MNKEVTESLAKAASEAAFRLHPNTGVWAISFYRRVASILEAFVNAGVHINPRTTSLARVLADTGVDPALALDAWKLASSSGEALEREMYSLMEAWQQE